MHAQFTAPPVPEQPSEGVAPTLDELARQGARQMIALALQLEVAEYIENFANPYIASSRGYIDEIIEPSETREKLVAAFKLLEKKRAVLPSKKHGNIPL